MSPCFHAVFKSDAESQKNQRGNQVFLICQITRVLMSTWGTTLSPAPIVLSGAEVDSQLLSFSYHTTRLETGK